MLGGVASARVIKIDECIVSLGGFCIVETLLAVLAAGLIFFFSSLPTRWIIKKYIKNQFEKNKNYKPSYLVVKIYENAGYVSMIIISTIICLFVLMYLN